ncbi:hypothetical protein AB5I41_26595 [Sphingomonas sp. MMS24-JH45]
MTRVDRVRGQRHHQATQPEFPMNCRRLPRLRQPRRHRYRVSRGRAEAAGGRDAELRALLDRFFYDRRRHSPEQATSLGLDTGARAALRAKLSDASRAGETRQFARARRELAALKAIPRAGLGRRRGSITTWWPTAWTASSPGSASPTGRTRAATRPTS